MVKETKKIIDEMPHYGTKGIDSPRQRHTTTAISTPIVGDRRIPAAIFMVQKCNKDVGDLQL